jgi:glycosyltransferase involved in cell wall biosynthesis
MHKARVLYVLHNHPAVHPGGGETYGYELYRAMRESNELEPILVARTGSSPRLAAPSLDRADTRFSSADADPNQYLVSTDVGHFDYFYVTSGEKRLYSDDFTKFLRAQSPDVVHFQHLLFIGYDLILQTRRILPNVPILHTLHDYRAMCHRDGRMVRTRWDELCRESSPRRCNECFPHISRGDFFMRDRFIKTCFSQVDLFLAPSRFLMERYVDWGIPREKIGIADYGRRRWERLPAVDEERPRLKLGFFGALHPHKGLDTLVQAMDILAEEETGAHLWIHGADLAAQPLDFQDELTGLLEGNAERGRNVTLGGPYDQTDLPKLIADIDWVVVPSRWWEGSPLVVQEAFLAGRPVICSDIGGMAEKVTHEVNGLHFRVGDPLDLAETLLRAVTIPGLWERLAGGIPSVPDIGEHVADLAGMYRELMDRRAAAVPARLDA